MWLGLRGTSLSLSLCVCASSRAGYPRAAGSAGCHNTCFTGRSVGCKFTAYNWLKCTNTRSVIWGRLVIFTNAATTPTLVVLISNLCLRGNCYNASKAVSTYCKKTAISKFDIEPTVLNLCFSTVAQSDQSSNFTYPPCAICMWPVAMAPSLTPSLLQNHCYPSGWSQDDPYHSNLDPSSHWIWVGEVLLC